MVAPEIPKLRPVFGVGSLDTSQRDPSATWDCRGWRLQKEAHVFLFQYGSNMDQERLEERIADPEFDRFVPDDVPRRAELKGAAYLVGWRFDLGGHNADQKRVCDIRPVGGNAVMWGALWDLHPSLVVRPDGQRSLFDRIEGYRRGGKSAWDIYRRIPVEVCFEAEPCQAWTYVCTPEARRCLRGCRHVADPCYTKHVLRGAAALALPDDYQAFLDNGCGEAQVGQIER